MGESSNEFCDCGQVFRSRNLAAVQSFDLVAALPQLLDHVVEAKAENANLVVAIGEVYCDIQVPFPDACDLLPEVQCK